MSHTTYTLSVADDGWATCAEQIATHLFITEGTVKNHVSSILDKLQAENRTRAADIARRHGLV